MELEDIMELVEERRHKPENDKKINIITFVVSLIAIILTVSLVYVSRLIYYSDYMGIFLNEHGPDYYKFGLYTFDYSYDGEQEIKVNGESTNHFKGNYYSVRDNGLCLNGSQGNIDIPCAIEHKDGAIYLHTFDEDGNLVNTYKKMKE